MRATEHTANQELARAAARIEWEGAHLDAWCAPAPRRATLRANRICDALMLATLIGTVCALVMGVL